MRHSQAAAGRCGRDREVCGIASARTPLTTPAPQVVENSSLTDEENLEALETEIAILRQLNHPHIVSLKEVVTTPSDTYIVMELLGGGELFNRIVDDGPFPEPKAASLFAQILFAMEHLHEQNIVHRDIKPENILYIEKGGLDIKLIDFGYAGLWAPDKQLTGLCGTPDYVAPEVLTWYDDDDEKGTPYGKGSDLWSMGVLLYVILSGCSPFSADEEEMLLQQVAQAKYEFYDNEWKGVSELAKDLVRKLLVVDPAERLSMEQVTTRALGPTPPARPAAFGTPAAARSPAAAATAPTPPPPTCRPMSTPTATRSCEGCRGASRAGDGAPMARDCGRDVQT